MSDLDTYEGEPVREIIRESVRASSSEKLVFLMGPYRLLNPSYLYPSDEYPLPSDPLAPDETAVDPDLIETTLHSIGKKISSETSATCFIAGDVDIPTRKDVKSRNLDEPGMPVIDQSVAFAKASEGNVFIFTKAGLTTGVGAEAGAIPEYFRLRDPEVGSKDPRSFHIFSEAELTDEGVYEPVFSSASIDEMDDAYDIRFGYFENREKLVERIIVFIESYLDPLQK